MDSIPSGWLSAEEVVHHRMESFHRERVRAIQGGEAPFRLREGGKLIIHLIPADSVRSRRMFSAADLKTHGGGINPLGDDSGQRRVNVDGLACYDWGDRDGRVGSYTQVFRDGRLEGIMTDAAYEQHGARVLRDGLCERAIFSVTSQYLGFCKGIGISPPAWLFAALAGCEAVRVREWHGLGDVAADRPVALLPEFEIGSFDFEPVSALRPVCDSLWNVFGLERSLNYDEKGEWRQRQ